MFPQDCELYVGNLPLDAAKPEIQEAFGELMDMLPEYRAMYPHLSSPVVKVEMPLDTTGQVGRYSFVQFADDVLACTALSMSGLRIRGRSCPVKKTGKSSATGHAFAKAGLNVEVLRVAGLIPWVGGPGMQLLCHVYIGGLGPDVCSDSRELMSMLTTAVLSVPEVSSRFPRLVQPVLGARINTCGSFAFVDMANEVLASTVVAMGRIELGNGCHARTSWPTRVSNAESRVPPSLVARRSFEEARPRNDKSYTESSRLEQGQGGANADDRAHDAACEVFIGCIHGVEAADLWRALEEAFDSLPSYRAAYPGPDGRDPVVKLHMGAGRGSGSYAFAQLANPTLASTLVKLAVLRVGDHKLPLNRPRSFKPPAGGASAPLAVGPSRRTVQQKPKSATSGAFLARPALCTLPDPLVPPSVPSLPQAEAALHVAGIPPLGSEEEAKALLDKHLTRQALASGQCDFEDGPPLRQLLLSRSRRTALVELRDASLALRLLPVFDGTAFLGKPIIVTSVVPNSAAAAVDGAAAGKLWRRDGV